MAAWVSGKNNNSSRFSKTVCLSEWWLIWADNEIHEKGLAIAGFTSLNQKALQVFSSAPILRRYDVFTLETTDGIYVVINGIMNKARTLENGFPSEVLNHFLFGFPPHWEACADKFLGQVFASNDVSRENAKGSSIANEGTNEKTYSRENVNVSPATAELNEDHTQEGSKNSIKAARYITSDGSMANTDCKKTASDEKETGKNVSPATADPKLDQDHTVCMTQTRSKKSNKAMKYVSSAGCAKNTDRKRSACDEKENVENFSPTSADPKPDQDDTVYMTQKRSKKCNKAESYVTSAGCANNTNRKETATVVEESGEYISSDPKLNQDHTVRVCMIQEGSKKSNIAVSYLTTAGAANNTDGKETTGVDPKLNQDDTGTVCMIQECSIKSNTAVRHLTCSGGAKNTDHKKTASVGKETIEYVSPSTADPKLDQDHTVCMTQKSSKKFSKAVRCVTSAGGAKNTDRNKTAAVVEETGGNVSPATADPELDQDHIVCMTQEVSKSNKAARYIMVSGARNTDLKETEAVEKESSIKEKATINEASTAVKKTKRRLTYGSPMTPKVDDTEAVVLPESLSSKKSRSGRLLLPTLEYWRNQTAVYDAEHQVIGIKQGINTPSRAEATHEPKKARRRPRKSEDSSVMKRAKKGLHGA